MSSPHSERRDSFPAGDPEWALLCRAVVDYAGQRPTVMQAPVDWQRLLALGERHRVQPLLATQLLHKNTAADLPDPVSRALVTAKQQNLEHILRMTAALERLEPLLAQADIDYRVLKGLPLAACAYHNVVDRHAGDIDLLLMDPAALDAVHALLAANGYRVHLAHAQYRGGLRTLYLRTRKENVYATPDSGLKLEIHWPSAAVPAFPAALLDACRGEAAGTVDCLGRRYLQPDSEALTDYLIWHGARTQWFRLKWLVDVYLLLRQADQAALPGLHGIDTVSWRLALALLQRLFGYAPGVEYPPPPAWLETTCLRALQAPDRLPVLTRLRATTALRRGWPWYSHVLHQYAIRLSDYQALSPPAWLVYATLPVDYASG